MELIIICSTSFFGVFYRCWAGGPLFLATICLPGMLRPWCSLASWRPPWVKARLVYIFFTLCCGCRSVVEAQRVRGAAGVLGNDRLAHCECDRWTLFIFMGELRPYGAMYPGGWPRAG